MKNSKRKMRKIKKRDKDKMTEAAAPKTLKDYEKNFEGKRENVDEDIITIDNGAIEDLRVDSDKEIKIEDLKVDSDKVFEEGGGTINKVFEVKDSKIDYNKEEKIMVELAEEGTLLAGFQKERTDAISEMFDNRCDNGLYPTSEFFMRLDNSVKNIQTDYFDKIKNLKVQRNIFIALFFLLLFLLVK